MDRNLNSEQQLMYRLLFSEGTYTHDIELDRYAEPHQHEQFIEYVLDVVEAGRMAVLADQMSMDFKRGCVWRLTLQPRTRQA
jgi:hypothetical protein